MARELLFSLIAVAFVVGAEIARAADGDPDPAFGVAGQLTIERPPSAITSSAPTGDVAALADGRFLWVMANEDASIWVGRAAYDGHADATFGDDASGRATLHDCTAFATTRLVANSDGGAVVWSGRCLLQLDANGQVESGFGGVPLSSPTFLAAALARDGAGRYVLAGNDGQQCRVFRFATDGTLDRTFGEEGQATVVIPATNGLRGLNALAIRGDDRIVVAGWRGNTHGPNLVIAALTENGDPDPTWNGNGLVDLDPPAGQQGLTATALAFDIDGSLVVAGKAYSGTVDCCALLARFDGDGQLVEDFGLSIFPLSGVMSTFFEQRDTVALLPDGKILYATTAFPVGSIPENHRTQFILVRARSNGALDPTFGDGGWRGYTISDPTGSGQNGDYDQLHAMAYADGSALLFGRTFFEDNSNGLDYISIVRATFDLVFANGFE